MPCIPLSCHTVCNNSNSMVFSIKKLGGKQVQKGGEMTLTRATEEKNDATTARENNKNKGVGTTKKSGVKKSLKR